MNLDIEKINRQSGRRYAVISGNSCVIACYGTLDAATMSCVQMGLSRGTRLNEYYVFDNNINEIVSPTGK